jgi:hypothetical protein
MVDSENQDSVSSPESESRAGERRRDAASLWIIGGFFMVFSLLVLLGLCWEERLHGIVVNLGAGLALLAVGLVMVLAALRLSKKPLP